MNLKALTVTTLVLAVLAAVTAGTRAEIGAQEKTSKSQSASVDKEAVERARKNVKMLDNVYKQAVVLITEKYVEDEDDFPAGSAAVELFKRIEKSGSHKVRLIDATGEPYEPENVAKSDFEKEGLKQLKAGKAYYDKVITRDGEPVLQAITPVPVVMDKCVMCHAHYADAKKGEPIGALSYEFPIE